MFVRNPGKRIGINPQSPYHFNNGTGSFFTLNRNTEVNFTIKLHHNKTF